MPRLKCCCLLSLLFPSCFHRELPPGQPDYVTLKYEIIDAGFCYPWIFDVLITVLQKIGDYYRGWVATDSELEVLLTLHKQQTKSVWGTRQSPCMTRDTTRLMWRSQYCPFDGIPFLNTGSSFSSTLTCWSRVKIKVFYIQQAKCFFLLTGSRAIVMECQFGPRRKGSASKKEEKENKLFKKTCPARLVSNRNHHIWILK